MILEAMYNGEFYPCETVVPTSPEYRKAVIACEKLMEQLSQRLKMGVFGAAFATVFSQAVAGLGSLWYILKHYNELRWNKEESRLSRKKLFGRFQHSPVDLFTLL